jgi:hypothetical protein
MPNGRGSGNKMPPGMRKPDFIQDNPCTTEDEQIIWKQGDSDVVGKLAPTQGPRARNYATVIPAPFDEDIAGMVNQYLGGRYSIDSTAWLKITMGLKLEPHFRESAWWRSPKGHDIPNQVYQYSPHMYIWMMGARYTENVAPTYTSPWDTFALLQPGPTDYFPLDGRVPPKELIHTAADAVKDMKAFHGVRNWNVSLARQTDADSGPGWRMPTLLELVRTHSTKAQGMSIPQLADWPFYYIMHYLSHCRQEPGYHQNAPFDRFTGDGTWDSLKIPYYLIPTYLEDEDFLKPREHSHTDGEVYWILVRYFHIKPELAYEFIAFAAAVAGPTDLDLRKLLKAFDYVDGRPGDADTMRYFETHPPTGDCLPAMLDKSSPTATKSITAADLEPWREHCWEEEATSSMRRIVKASLYPPTTSDDDDYEVTGDYDENLPTPTTFPLVQVDGPMFNPAYFSDPHADLGPLLPLKKVKPSKGTYYGTTSQVEAQPPTRVVSRSAWPADGEEKSLDEKIAATKRAAQPAKFQRILDSQKHESVIIPHLLAGQKGMANPWLATCVENNAARDTSTPVARHFPEYKSSGKPEEPPARPAYAPHVQASATWTLDTHPIDHPIGTWPDEDKVALIHLVTKENEDTITSRNLKASQPLKAKPKDPKDSMNLAYDVFDNIGKKSIGEALIVVNSVAAQKASHDKNNKLVLVNRPEDTEIGIVSILRQRRSQAAEAAQTAKSDLATQQGKAPAKPIFSSLQPLPTKAHAPGQPPVPSVDVPPPPTPDGATPPTLRAVQEEPHDQKQSQAQRPASLPPSPTQTPTPRKAWQTQARSRAFLQPWHQRNRTRTSTRQTALMALVHPRHLRQRRRGRRSARPMVAR